jgi:uncharacterized repeat protein (TIGR03803 family)
LVRYNRRWHYDSACGGGIGNLVCRVELWEGLCVHTLTEDLTGNPERQKTTGGGAFGNGTIFVLAPQPGGGWAETVLHSFGGQGDGAIPYTAGLVFDTGGNVYGTTVNGGNYGLGTVFELSLQ